MSSFRSGANGSYWRMLAESGTAGLRHKFKRETAVALIGRFTRPRRNLARAAPRALVHFTMPPLLRKA